jgi:hypothetical protein
MLYNVTHTATPLHVLYTGTSPKVLLSSLFDFQFKTPPHRQSESHTNNISGYIFEACTSHQCSQHKEMNSQHGVREFSKIYSNAHGTEITHLVSDWKDGAMLPGSKYDSSVYILYNRPTLFAGSYFQDILERSKSFV